MYLALANAYLVLNTFVGYKLKFCIQYVNFTKMPRLRCISAYETSPQSEGNLKPIVLVEQNICKKKKATIFFLSRIIGGLEKVWSLPAYVVYLFVRVDYVYRTLKKLCEL